MGGRTARLQNQYLTHIGAQSGPCRTARVMRRLTKLIKLLRILQNPQKNPGGDFEWVRLEPSKTIAGFACRRWQAGGTFLTGKSPTGRDPHCPVALGCLNQLNS